MKLEERLKLLTGEIADDVREFKRTSAVPFLKLISGKKLVGSYFDFSQQLQGIEEIGDLSSTKVGGLNFSSINKISEGAFLNSNIYGNVVFKNNVVIEKSAFKNTIVHGDVIIPSTATLGDNAFENAVIKGKITVASASTSKDVFLKLSANELDVNMVTVPSGLFRGMLVPKVNLISTKDIGNNAFADGKISGILTLPDTIVWVKDRAFYNNEITGVQFRLNYAYVYFYSECFRQNNISSVGMGYYGRYKPNSFDSGTTVSGGSTW